MSVDLIVCDDMNSVAIVYRNSFLTLRKFVDNVDKDLMAVLPHVDSVDELPVPGLAEGAPRVDGELALKVFGTMKAIDTEAHFSIWRNVCDGTWRVTLAKQTVGAAFVRYEELDIDDPSFQLVGTIHSHPGFSAEFSTTDINDQEHNANKFHLVYAFSKSTGRFRGMSGVAVLHGVRFPFLPDFVFPYDEAVRATKKDADPKWVKELKRSKEIYNA